MRRITLALLPALFLTAGAGLPGDDLEVQCRATETAVPASCGCTLSRARTAGLSDRQLASLFRDDGRSQPVDQSIYSRFWEIKIQCVAEATTAALPSPGSNPPRIGSASAARPAAQPQRPAPAVAATPIPVTPQRPTNRDQVFYFTPDATRAMLAALEGTTWRRTFEDGSTASYQFLPNRVVVQTGRNYTERYRAIVSDEPGFRTDFPGIRARADGLFSFSEGQPIQPYLALAPERGRPTEFWLAYWGGDELLVGYSYRSDQFYAADRLVRIAGRPRPLTTPAPAPAPVASATSTAPLASRIGTFDTWPDLLGQPGGCDTTILRPTTEVRTARQLAATRSRLPIYLADNIVSDTRVIAALRLDGRAILLEADRNGEGWNGEGLRVAFERTNSYAPGNYGVGYGEGFLVVTAGTEVARLPALSATAC